MKKLNKKGFTLIELLAVIAILAIIVVIAVPGVLNLYKTGKQDATLTQAKSILKIAQDQLISDDVSGNTGLSAHFCNPAGTETRALNLSSGDALYDITIVNGKVTNFTIVSSGYKVMVTGTDIKSSDIVASTIQSGTFTSLTCSNS